MGNHEAETALYRPSARAAARFRARSLQSRATGAHSLYDAYHDGWRRHLSTLKSSRPIEWDGIPPVTERLSSRPGLIIPSLCVLRVAILAGATHSGRLVD